MSFTTAIQRSLKGPSPAFGFWLTYVPDNPIRRNCGADFGQSQSQNGKLCTLLIHFYSLPSAAVAKTILHGASGSSTKFSWVLVDAEHGLISDTNYYEVCLQNRLSNAVRPN